MTTPLEILNHCMGVVGEGPVTSYDSNHPTALKARALIDGLNREIQLRGWWFNKEFNLTLTVDSNDEIILPQDTLEVYPYTPHKHLVKRGGKLYDPQNHTTEIAEDVTVDLTILLDIEDMPDVASLFVKHKAAYDFYVADDGDNDKADRLEREMSRAWQALQSKQLQLSRLNSNNRPVTAHLRSRTHQRGSSYDPRYPGGGR